jgi:RND family efflux transporter MFP subunit
MKKRMAFMVLALVVVFGGVFGWKAVGTHFMRQYFATFQPPPEAVATAHVATSAWQATVEAVGSVRAAASIDAANEVAGIVRAIAFESGARVAKGDLLVQLDDAADRAELDGLLAEEKLATINLRREETIAKQRLGSASDLDTARTKLEQARARVVQKRELIAKKAIRAPFAGELGIRRVDLGQYVPSGTELVSLVALDPIYVDFNVPEQELGNLRPGQTVAVTVPSYPDRFAGAITALDARIDEKTRNVRVRATLTNVDRRLRPGMFANVSVQLSGRPEHPTVPRTALTYSLYGDFLYVVEADGEDDKGQAKFKAVQRFVKAGATRANDVAITEGVQAGEEVVIAGQFKLHNNAAVRIDNDVVPQ